MHKTVNRKLFRNKATTYSAKTNRTTRRLTALILRENLFLSGASTIKGTILG